MAGTLMYEVRPVHTFQRRFDSLDLGRALADCQIYIISRRPSVRIDAPSVMFYPKRLTFEVSTRKHSLAEHEVHTFALDGDILTKANDFRVYENGSYFSFRVDAALFHGDAWSLSSLCSGTREDISRHEVLYVGQAFGNGNSDAWKRTKRHEKLQKIYEEHSDGGWDIFVTACQIVRCNRTNVDHILDDDLGAVEGFIDSSGTFWDKENRRATKTAVSLTEHSLIAYFDPPYNDLLGEWRVENPTTSMRLMRKAGFRLLRVHLNGVDNLARFQSRQAQKATRSHAIFHDIPPEPRRPVLRGISADISDQWGAGIVLLNDPGPIIEQGEISNFVLRSFGVEAPKVRKPIDVVLHPEDLDYSETLKQHFEKLARIEFEYEGPDFDPSTGLLSVGYTSDGKRTHWRVFESDGLSCHGVIMGPPGSGKTNLLNIVTIGVASSGLVLPWIADIGNRHRIEKWLPLADWLAIDMSELLLMFGAAASIAESRRSLKSDFLPRPEAPLIVITLEDAHVPFAESVELVRHAETIAECGPRAGVVLIVSVPDGNIARFGGSAKLRSLLGKTNLCALGQQDGEGMFQDFNRS